METHLRYDKNHIFRGIGGVLPEHRWKVIGVFRWRGETWENELAEVDLWSSFPPELMTGPSRSTLQRTLEMVKDAAEETGSWRFAGYGSDWYRYKLESTDAWDIDEYRAFRARESSEASTGAARDQTSPSGVSLFFLLGFIALGLLGPWATSGSDSQFRSAFPWESAVKSINDGSYYGPYTPIDFALAVILCCTIVVSAFRGWRVAGGISGIALVIFSWEQFRIIIERDWVNPGIGIVSLIIAGIISASRYGGRLLPKIAALLLGISVLLVIRGFIAA